MSHDLHRKPTGESSRGVSLPRRLTQPFHQQSKKTEPKYKLYRESYGVYSGMTWDKLKGYLEQKFPQSKYPGLEFNEDCALDHWIFEVPEPLTDEDKRELRRLRDKPTAPGSTQQAPATSQEKRRSVSPE
ncbi:uncharacterized protein PV07_00211 [Cladophialophora immunda]|uniref:Uncharacterized protein n=1 Tax=Cladophialophora immunda TaxID=569365 RepID=A0A0D2DCA2_9EURO|nr:uncharacterized protein PV07_00211 [Cladophialophora immunda]KIW33354.1 hypothetical protein PV07_00211 [Cladophialophora immunda]